MMLSHAACDPGGTECVCQPTGLLLQICPALVHDVRAIALGGVACTGGKVERIDAGEADGGPTSYQVDPRQPGACTIDVTFTSGMTFSYTSADFGYGPGCCPGLYAAGTREVEACVEAGVGDAEAMLDARAGS